MPRVGFEPTVLVFERAKTVHALYRATAVIGSHRFYENRKKKKEKKSVHNSEIERAVYLNNCSACK
jgi:hypothetical protein